MTGILNRIVDIQLIASWTVIVDVSEILIIFPDPHSYFAILPCKRSLLLSHKFKVINLCTFLSLSTIPFIMATNGNVVFYPLVQKQTIRKSAHGNSANPIPTRRLNIGNHLKAASPGTKPWLETHPDIWSEITYDSTGTVKTTTYTNIIIITMETVSIPV